MKRRSTLILLGALILALAAPACPGARAAGPSNPVILRDAYGVPHIYAETLYDLFHANGYAVAVDRLTQLELYRRASLGRLAEMLGPGMLETDIATRRDLYTAAERAALLAALPAEQRLMLEAYRDGINIRLAEVRGKPELLPWDLKSQGISPADWTVDHSVAILVFMGRTFGEFGGAAGYELANQRLFQHLTTAFGRSQGEAIFNDVVPIEDPAAPATIGRGATAAHAPAAAQGRSTGSSLRLADGLLEDAAAQAARVRKAREAVGIPTKLGSFWWAVSGERSSTGAALLFGGPQMGYATPNVGMEVGLHGAGFDVRGLAFAGAPGVLIGQNGRVAWSVTSGFGDQVDLYVETLDPADPSRYWHKGGWHPMQERVEVFQVAGAAPVTEVMRRTVHGPVVAVDPAAGIALAERRSHWGREAAVWSGMLAIDAVESAAAGVEIVAGIPLSLNFLFADQDGHIAYRQAGRQPVRPAGFDPRLPFPGAGQAEWRGFLDPNAMPHVIDPPLGVLGNWNNKPMPGWANGDAVTWGAVDRVQRIFDLLEGAGPVTPEAAKAIAPDIGRRDYRADALLPFLLAALGEPDLSADPRLPQAAQILADWNLRADEGALGESIFSAWRTQVFSDTFGDELGPYVTPLLDLVNTAGDSLLLRALQGPLAGLPVARDYFNGTPPPQALVSSLSRALDALTAAYGTPDMARWAFDPGTIDFTLGPLTFASIPWYSRGSYMQFIALTRPVAAGENILPPGQSGALLVGADGFVHLDPHFLDQVELARSWQYKPMPLRYLPARGYVPLAAK